jgi:hypothetical protein
MEDSYVLNEIFEVGEQSILDKLSLQKAPFVNWAVKEALETHVPEKVGAIFFCEEVL